MRTELKIGIAAGLFIAVVAVIYVVLADLGSEVKTTPEPPPGQSLQAQAPAEGGQPGQTGEPSAETGSPADTGTSDLADDTDVASGGVTDNATAAGDTSAGSGTEAAASEGTASGLRQPLDSSAGAAPADTGDSSLIVSAEVETVDLGARDTSALGVRDGGAGTTVTVRPPDRTTVVEVADDTQKERTYFVQAGDQGFWTVAEKMYGNGADWPVIAKANPDVDPRRLRVGMELRVPPLPRSAGAGAAAATGGSDVAPTAVRAGTYHVKRTDDKGLWGIAENVYGDGSLWRVIASANPNVEPTAMRPGTALVIPPRPVRGTTSPAGVGGNTVVEGGVKRYFIKKDDSGFWTVALKMYGDGKYWPVIAEANPGLDPLRLRPGQPVVVPELTEEMRRRFGRTGAPTRPGREPVPLPEPGSDRPARPIFD